MAAWQAGELHPGTAQKREKLTKVKDLESRKLLPNFAIKKTTMKKQNNKREIAEIILNIIAVCGVFFALYVFMWAANFAGFRM